ncbi:MAG: hypothetical protein IPK19_10845 [Chloroflexi bacterium]|nr:hypothetical protein [Chloroflexota bacterium]
MAFSPTPKNPGDLIRSQDWNEALDEVVRLESAKLNRTGGSISGSLTIAGALGVGSATAPNRSLTVRGASGTYLNVIADNGTEEVLLGADAAGGIVSTITNHDLQLRAGGNQTRLTIKADGNVGIGTTTPGHQLDVANRIRIRQGSSGSAGVWLFQSTPNADRAFIGMADDNTVGLWGNGGIGWGLRMNVGDGDILLEGDLSIRKTAGGYATFTNNTYSNEATLQANNLKLVMGSDGGLVIIGSPPLSYEFAVGHTFNSPIIIGGGGGGTSFVKRFSVNQAGNVSIAGSLSAGGGKGGYVVDNFINAVGEPLEQGDIVIISSAQVTHYYGQNDSIPVPEVDLTATAYDTRVCGIVESVVLADSLPPFDIQYPTEEEVQAIEKEKSAKKKKAAQEALAARMENPLASFAAPVTREVDSTQVGPGQLGKMVTLGAYAYCKVDADIAPIAVGDLLTTSPTRGHAQKVTDPSKALGTILGKALGSLDSGKGKIPILVLLH